MRQLFLEKYFPASKAGSIRKEICGIRQYATDMCPAIQEGSHEQANAVEGFLGQPRQRYDPYSNFYNEGWKDHPNFRYGNKKQGISNVAPSRPPGYPQHWV